jgi:hypothetical protein
MDGWCSPSPTQKSSPTTPSSVRQSPSPTQKSLSPAHKSPSAHPRVSDSSSPHRCNGTGKLQDDDWMMDAWTRGGASSVTARSTGARSNGNTPAPRVHRERTPTTKLASSGMESSSQRSPGAVRGQSKQAAKTRQSTNSPNRTHPAAKSIKAAESQAPTQTHRVREVTSTFNRMCVCLTNMRCRFVPSK